LNILREDWKPVLNLGSVMVGLQYLFLEPNADDPLNKGKNGMIPSALSCMYAYPMSMHSEAAEDLRRDREQFLRNVKTSLRGGSIKGEQYDKVALPTSR
jgi:ubiquitin-conjugating enzyme E2 M